VRLTTKRVLDIIKGAFYLTLIAIAIPIGIRTYKTLGQANSFIQETKPRTNVILDNSATLVATLNTDLVDLRTTIKQANETIQSAKEMVDTQKGFQKEQNEKVLGVLDQTETALENFQRQMEEIKEGTVGTEQAAQKAIEQLTPVLEETVRTIQSAHGVIGDPNIKKAIEQMAVALEHAAAVMSNFEKTSAHIEKKVDDMTKPVAFWKTAVQTLLGIAANLRQAIGH
jgi:ABC-type transporter Mla subunit MlaD